MGMRKRPEDRRPRYDSGSPGVKPPLTAGATVPVPADREKPTGGG